MVLEFAKHFDIYLEKNDTTHFIPIQDVLKQNSEIERFNRTLRTLSLNKTKMLLAYDIDAFNQKLIDWLLWYNTRRPHWSLDYFSLLRYNVSTLTAKESQMC